MKNNHKYKQVKMIKRFIFLLVSLGIVALYFGEDAVGERVYIDDEAQVLSEQTKELIIRSNEQDFQQLTGSPQFVVKTIKHLPKNQSIESYAVESFEALGIGTKELDNGFLFVIALEDRKYRLEVGYGVEEIITDSMKREIIPLEIEELFRAENYDEGIQKISQNIITTVKQRYGHYDLSKQEVTKATKYNSTYQEPKKDLFDYVAIILKWGFYVIILIIILIIIYAGSVYLIRSDAKNSSLMAPIRNKKIFIVSKTKKVSILEKIDGSYLVPMFFAHFNKYERIQKKIAECLFEDVIIELARNTGKGKLEQMPEKNRQTYCEMCIELAAPFWSDYYLKTKEILVDQTHLEQANEKLKSCLMENYKQMQQLLDSFLLARKNFLKTKNLVQTFVKTQMLKKPKQESLLIMLTTYFLLLNENTLALDFSEKSTQRLSEKMPKAYKKAKKKIKNIDVSYYREASKDIHDMLFITELPGIDLSNYKYIKRLSVISYIDFSNLSLSGGSDSYHNSSSSSSSGDSPGGGGSSGGGGFSGGW